MQLFTCKSLCVLSLCVCCVIASLKYSQYNTLRSRGKHGTLEWLPGKGVGLSSECYPDTFLDDMPLIYPFIINDVS